jgi:predicted nucleic acid-binding Zn ribbon protein
MFPLSDFRRLLNAVALVLQGSGAIWQILVVCG